MAGIAASAGAQSYDFIRSKARQIAQRFESVVIERLHETAAEGGVEEMMGVFTAEAYQTAEYLSGQTDWRVRRSCLVCHGQNIEPEIAERLERRYPNDPATGYSIGEIRGAYSLCTPNSVLPLPTGP